MLYEVRNITNISRHLINENILKINQIIGTISFLNEIVDSIMTHLKPLYIARRFLFLHSESLIHHSRIRPLFGKMTDDIDLIKQYLNIHSTGKWNPTIIDPIHLRRELLKFTKQLPSKLALLENSHSNIWHAYRFLTVNPVIHRNKLILMIRIPLVDLDSGMNLYKIYNLPIFHQNIGKSLKYQLEGTNLFVTRDNKSATIFSDTEFIKCTLAEGHFCNLNTGHYHVDTTQWCVIAIFFKDNDRISKYCKLAVNNITGPQANYIDQGHWAISLDKSTQMEKKYEDHTHVKTLKPPLTFIILQPACSAFSSDIKLPPYLKQCSKGFHVALKSANLHVSIFIPTKLRTWTHFNLTHVTPVEVENLKKLEPAPAIPIDQLRA